MGSSAGTPVLVAAFFEKGIYVAKKEELEQAYSHVLTDHNQLY